MIQKKEKPKEEITLVYSKKVNDTTITSDKKTRKIDKDKITKVVDSLLALGKTKFFKDLQLKNNCKDWVNSIISLYPSVNERDVKELLNDFSDDMNTRMRTEEKYALCIITSDFVILCHSIFGEETITPKWEVIARMLDKDNVLRFVYFKKENGDVKVIYYEANPSVFLANWLGIPEKEAFEYLGGKNKVCGDINGVSICLELSDDDFEKKFLEQKVFKIKDKQLILPGPIESIPLSMIKVGRKPYTEVNDFIQDFLAKRYNLSYYQEQYTALNSSLNFDLLSKKIIDEKLEVKNSNGKSLIKKTNPNFLVLFTNQSIEIRSSLLSEIKSRLMNNDSFRIFHAGGKVSAQPLKIKNLELYNEIKAEITNIILAYYSNLQVKDKFDNIFLGTIFKLLALENKESNVCHFLNQLANLIFSDLCQLENFVNSEDNLLELKSCDVVSGDNAKIVDYFSQDINKKIEKSKIKIYVIGANEDTKQFEPISVSKFDDNRIESLTNSIKQKTKIQKINLLKIPTKEGKECLLIMVVGCQDETAKQTPAN